MPTVLEELTRDPRRTDGEIAALCGVSRPAVVMARRRHGIAPGAIGRPKQPPRVAVRLTREELYDVLNALALANVRTRASRYAALAVRIEAQIESKGDQCSKR